MAQTVEFTIGADVSCLDGPCGNLSRVVINPIARAVTHLVVEPRHRGGLDRLVPLDLVAVQNDEVQLRCGLADFEKLEAAEETHFLPVDQDYVGYGQGQVLLLPYFGPVRTGPGVNRTPQFVTENAVPEGEVDVRRGEQVSASDGDIGRVKGLLVDPDERLVTHVLLQEGHLWGSKEVAIPIAAVTSVDGGIQVNMTKQQVQNLPPVEVDHPRL